MSGLGVWRYIKGRPGSQAFFSIVRIVVIHEFETRVYKAVYSKYFIMQPGQSGWISIIPSGAFVSPL
jgi:hypothetical protein